MVGTEANVGTEIEALARSVLARCKDAGLMVTAAESCTGGLVMASLVDVAGSSAVVERGFVTYSNAAKIEMLGVPASIIAGPGAVSEPCARAMAEGALAQSRAHIAVAITGIAGPGGGTVEKPEGLVHFACKREQRETRHVERKFGALGRTRVRELSVRQAFEMILEAAQPAD